MAEEEAKQEKKHDYSDQTYWRLSVDSTVGEKKKLEFIARAVGTYESKRGPTISEAVRASIDLMFTKEGGGSGEKPRGPYDHPIHKTIHSLGLIGLGDSRGFSWPTSEFNNSKGLTLVTDSAYVLAKGGVLYDNIRERVKRARPTIILVPHPSSVYRRNEIADYLKVINELLEGLEGQLAKRGKSHLCIVGTRLPITQALYITDDLVISPIIDFYPLYSMMAVFQHNGHPSGFYAQADEHARLLFNNTLQMEPDHNLIAMFLGKTQKHFSKSKRTNRHKAARFAESMLKTRE
jgi:hypothetical protein